MGTALALILKVIDIAQTAIPAGVEVFHELEALKIKMQGFQDAGTEPTAEDFAILNDELDALTDRLNVAAARFTAGG